MSVSADQRSDERIVGAAEDDDLRGASIERLAEVDAEDVAGDGVVDPALFDEWHQQRAGLLVGRRPRARRATR